MFLLRIAVHCFSATVPQVDFCVQMIDLMQYLAPCFMNKKRPQCDPRGVVRRVTERAQWHLNVERDPSRAWARRATVLMFDTPHRVPKSKSGTQKSRDDSREPTTPTTPTTTDPVTTSDGVALLSNAAGPWMDEAMYEQLRQYERNGLLLRLDSDPLLPLSNAVVWRTVSLRLQLYRLLTHALLRLQVPDGQALVFDDGVAVSEQRFAELFVEAMANHPEMNQMSPYERHVFFHQLLVEHQHYSRFILYDDAQFKRFLPSEVGEADIKIQAYVQRDSGAKRFLVVNQDTDVIFVLLLHMQAFLEGAREPCEEHDDLEVWIDCLSPSDDQHDRPYRYINIKALYYAIHALFATHFPGIAHPVETLCALVFCLKTDYTSKFASCLGVTPGLVWETFAQLHNVGPAAPAWNKRAVCTAQHPREMYGVLQQAVQYDAHSQAFWLDRQAWSQFNYYLCQQGLVQVRRKLQLYCVPGLLSAESLLVYAGEVSERVDAHLADVRRREQEMRTSLSKTTTLSSKRAAPSEDVNPQARKTFKPSSGQRRVPVATAATATSVVEESASMDEIFARPLLTPGNDMATFLRQNEDTLRKLARKKVPPQCGVPTQQEMLARLQRLQWYLWYCRHGWQDPLCAETCIQQDARGRSLWGWCEQETEVSNSTYNGVHYDGTHFTYYGVAETNDVI